MIKFRIILASIALVLAVGFISVLPGFHSNGQPLTGPASNPFRGIHTVLAAGAVSSLKSGNWSDPSIWSGGGVPGAADAVTIATGHTVTYELADSRVSGVTIEDNAKLAFAPAKTALLRTDKNILVLGELEMKPSSAPVHHTIRFVEVDELNFVGAGMNVVDTDVGLWVRGDGLLDIAGTSKTSWTRLQAGANAGNSSIRLQSAPTGWRVGDEISIVPTEPPTVGGPAWSGFEVRTITAISGEVVTLNSPISRDHPAATDPNSKKTFTAEVLNLSRNVHIEGTGDGSADPAKNGRAHIQILSTVPQSVSYAELKLLGPRRYSTTFPTEGVSGRYPLHFHHSGNGSRGSLIEGTVVRQSGGRAFVPHASHGITFRDTIAYDIWDDAYWWDPPAPNTATIFQKNDTTNNSNDTLFDRAVAAMVKFDPEYYAFGITGFVLQAGSGNEIRDSVAVGVRGATCKTCNASGFEWPESANQNVGGNVWTFSRGNISHNNNNNGIFTWQNDSNIHIVDDFVAYHNGGSAIDHGAYGNKYQYKNVIVFGNGRYSLESHAAATSSNAARSDGYSLVFENYKTDGPLIFPKHNAAAQHPNLFKDCIFTAVMVNDGGDGGQNPTKADFVNCTKPNGQSLEPADFTLQQVVQGLEIRVQRPDGTAYGIQDAGTITTIAPFYAVTPSSEPPPANQAPTVSAGQNSSITLPADASLDGSVSDDGLPDPPAAVTTSWSKISGPGSVAFGSAALLDTTVSFSEPGIYVLRLTADDGELSASDDISITVNAAGIQPQTQQHQIPGLIESEDYKAGGEGVAYHDTTEGNSGGAYRSDDVDIQATSDDWGGYHISQVVRGEWLVYDVVVAQDGEYDITARVASGSTQTKTFHLEMDGQDVTGPANFDYSSGWHSWRDFTVRNIPLTVGQHELRLVFDTGSYRINYLDVVASNQESAATIISPQDGNRFPLPIFVAVRRMWVMLFTGGVPEAT